MEALTLKVSTKHGYIYIQLVFKTLLVIKKAALDNVIYHVAIVLRTAPK